MRAFLLSVVVEYEEGLHAYGFFCCIQEVEKGFQLVGAIYQYYRPCGCGNLYVFYIAVVVVFTCLVAIGHCIDEGIKLVSGECEQGVSECDVQLAAAIAPYYVPMPVVDK